MAEEEVLVDIAVTGGSGFVGQELIRWLSLSPSINVINIDMVPGALDVDEIVHDLTTGPVNIEADFCFHLASAAGGLLFNQQEDVIDYNAKVNENTFLSCGPIPMAFVSTLNVFEGAKSIRDMPLDPITPYAKSKVQGEQYFLENVEDLYIVRPCNIFGKSQIGKFSKYGESHVIPDILHKIENAETSIEVWGDGSQKRGFLHVADIAAFLASLTGQRPNVEHNICSSLILSIRELVDELIQFSGKVVEAQYDAAYMQYEKMFIENIEDDLEDVGSFNSITEGLSE